MMDTAIWMDFAPNTQMKESVHFLLSRNTATVQLGKGKRRPKMMHGLDPIILGIP